MPQFQMDALDVQQTAMVAAQAADRMSAQEEPETARDSQAVLMQAEVSQDTVEEEEERVQSEVTHRVALPVLVPLVLVVLAQ